MRLHRSIKFSIPGAVVPKARARVTRKETYMPSRYQQWKDDAIAEFIYQNSNKPPIDYPVSIEVEIYGAVRGDVDNIAGAILDAMVQSNVLIDDRISIVPQLKITHFRHTEKSVIVIVSEILDDT